MRALIRTLLLAALAVLALSACGGGDEAATVEMLDNTFVPENLTVAAGEPITFVNIGLVEHNAIATDGSWSTTDEFGRNLESDETVDVTIDTPGEYEYYCDLHAIQRGDGSWAGMVGTITVTEAEAAGPSLVAGDLVVAQEDDAAEPELISAEDVPVEWTGVTRDVPGDYPTIQAGVDAAEPGDLVLVGPGIYKEGVQVVTPGITIRGTDRNEVILDGEFTRDNGIIAVANGVAMENMTARNYNVNGFFWTDVVGYRGSYLTAIDNRVYGIYAFNSVDGLFEYSYASGSFDGGYYIGQCRPCNAVIANSVAEYNGMGYSGTNSSTEIYLVNNEFGYNQSGIVPNSLDSELLPPVGEVYIGGNYIHDSGLDKEVAPYNSNAYAAIGNGIILAGSLDSVVEKNLVVNSTGSGIQANSMIDANLWPSERNTIRDNVILGSKRADVAIGGPLQSGSCVEGENGETTVPSLLDFTASCDGFVWPMPWGMATSSEPLARFVEYTLGGESPMQPGDAPDPELSFENLPSGAEVVPAVNVFDNYDLDISSITTPETPSGLELHERDLVILGINTQAGFWPVVAGALLWWIPLLVWGLVGLWALIKAWSREASTAEKVVWTILVVLIPVIGVMLFALFGNRDTPVANRWISTGTALVVWLAAVFGLFYPLLF